jgi:hypothetical protein
MNTRIPPFGEKPPFKIPGIKDQDIPWLRRLIIETVQELKAIQEATRPVNAIQ